MLYTFVVPCWYQPVMIKKYNTDTFAPAVDSFDQPLKSLDKVIWSPDDGRYRTAVYLGLSPSGKSGRALVFMYSKHSQKSYTEVVQVSPDRLFKIDWPDDLITQEHKDIRSNIVAQIIGGANVITVA